MVQNPDQNDNIVNAAGGLSRVRDRLERVNEAVDWSRFDKYLRWPKSDFFANDEFEPVLLFKAMLILHWHAFTAPEFDHAIEDNITIRNFVGLNLGEHGPHHLTVNAFRRFLVDRGTANDALTELHRQLSKTGFLSIDHEVIEIDENSTPDALYSLANDVWLTRPAAWVPIEKFFVDFWKEHCRDGNIPVVHTTSYDTVPQHLLQQFVVLDIDDKEFRFVHAGSAITAQNQGDLVKASVVPRHKQSSSALSHMGAQDELISICRAAMNRQQPVATSTRFNNAKGDRKNLWAILAPVIDKDTKVTRLAGAVLITDTDDPVSENSDVTSAKMSMLPAEIDPFSLETDFRTLGPPEWLAMENTFLTYWNTQRGIHKTPMTTNMKLADLTELEPYLTLTRVLKNRGFQYELIGDHIQAQNEGNATGQFVAEKRNFNLKEYGHGGLQDELGSIFSRAVAQLQPVGTNTYYVNSGGARCQMWTIHAPMSDENGEVCMLIGVTLIKKISVN
jgi:hypothetical protein